MNAYELLLIFALRYPVRSFLLCGKTRDGQTDGQSDFLLVKNVMDKGTNRQIEGQTDGQSDRLLTDIII